MSDTFDHEGDAWNDRLERGENGGFNSYEYHFRGGFTTPVDPNYFHSWVTVKVLRDSEKAYFVEKMDVRFWVPKSLVRRVSLTGIFVHTETFNAIFQNALSQSDDLDGLPDLD